MHVDVHGRVCMLWADASCSRRDVLAWLAVVHGYEVSFIPTECFY